MKTGNRREATGNSKKSKIVGFALSALLFALCFSAEAQQAKKVPLIGFIGPSGILFDSFWQGLHHLGYVESKNVLIESRDAEGRLDRIPALVNELVQQKVDVIVATNNVAILAAKKATQAIPIVIVSSVDPVVAGYVDSLAHPGE